MKNKEIKENLITLNTQAGQQIIIRKKGMQDFEISEVPGVQGDFNSFGAKLE